MEVCRKAYPLINEIENRMRKFIVNFMILKVGSDWWTLNTRDTLIKKAEDRKSNTTPYRDVISQDIFHIDFKDLISFIKGFSGFKTKEDVIKKLLECKDFSEVQKLQKEALSNWERFFNSIFSNQFLIDWATLADFRNQGAHNKLLGSDALQKITQLHDKLKSDLDEAISKIQGFRYSEEEIQAIKDKISEGKNLALTAAIETLERDYSLTVDNIVEFIETYKSKGKLEFSTFALIFELTDSYKLHEPINRAVGRILGEMKNDLSIAKTGEVEKVEDDTGTPTNSTIWQIIV